MKRIAGLLILPLIAGCAQEWRNADGRPSPGVEYRNQMTAPWPWVSVVPSKRAIALRHVSFEEVSKQIHFDLAFEPHYNFFKEVQLIVIDYTILPHEATPGRRSLERPRRYFMTASFYKAGNRPPCPPDIEISTNLRVDKAGSQESILYMARDIIEEIHTLDKADELTAGKKIMVNLD